MKRVNIESPFMGKKFPETIANVAYARACMADCLKRGEAPIASHLLYPQKGILDDNIPEERGKGVKAGLEWNLLADTTVVYYDKGVSEGMKMGIKHAIDNGRELEFRSLYKCSK